MPHSSSPISREERVRGALLGLLVGDALGVPYEFTAPEELPPMASLEMTPPSDFRRAHRSVPPGTWSDDGAQALCLLASLLDKGHLDLDDFAARLLAWYERGAFAVRSLAGVIDRIGLLRHDAATERNVTLAYRHYRQNPGTAAAQAFAKALPWQPLRGVLEVLLASHPHATAA